MAGHKLYIGTSGWSYNHWEGTFYPEGLPKKQQFEYYCQRLDSVEINNSFYRLPSEETMAKWKAQASDGFRYVLKASRYITHVKRLHDPHASTKRFFDHARILGPKLAAVLFQLPPQMKADLPRLEAFLQAIPKTSRCVFEFRNPTWYVPETYRLLREHNCAFCIYELAGHRSPLEVTADFVYVRLHCPGQKYQGDYSEATLRQWAGRCREWSRGKDVFVYFDNDEKGYAVFNAIRLGQLLS